MEQHSESLKMEVRFSLMIAISTPSSDLEASVKKGCRFCVFVEFHLGGFYTLLVVWFLFEFCQL